MDNSNRAADLIRLQLEQMLPPLAAQCQLAADANAEAMKSCTHVIYFLTTRAVTNGAMLAALEASVDAAQPVLVVHAVDERDGFFGVSRAVLEQAHPRWLKAGEPVPWIAYLDFRLCGLQVILTRLGLGQAYTSTEESSMNYLEAPEAGASHLSNLPGAKEAHAIINAAAVAEVPVAIDADQTRPAEAERCAANAEKLAAQRAADAEKRAEDAERRAADTEKLAAQRAADAEKLAADTEKLAAQRAADAEKLAADAEKLAADAEKLAAQRAADAEKLAADTEKLAAQRAADTEKLAAQRAADAEKLAADTEKLAAQRAADTEKRAANAEKLAVDAEKLTSTDAKTRAQSGVTSPPPGLPPPADQVQRRRLACGSPDDLVWDFKGIDKLAAWKANDSARLARRFKLQIAAIFWSMAQDEEDLDVVPEELREELQALVEMDTGAVMELAALYGCTDLGSEILTACGVSMCPPRLERLPLLGIPGSTALAAGEGDIFDVYSGILGFCWRLVCTGR
ncbi:hypothetical protein CYMTET_26054 [Cymbomonas tetramitiformis]|uniref:FAZ1 C-terminal region domain-containing protein n=1 Tax=Cymbomonas tetramitiformis TaxID=36881 RepID=A0AAE0FSU9_9CHLO|nr:hypothetical protein CYMTET_26054 [Cymbomonas tetramitiformis]